MKIPKIKKFFSNMLSEIFVDKYNCIVCDEELREPSKYGLCPSCFEKIRFIQDDICKKCGRLQLNEADYCLTCQAHKRHFDFARSCAVYDDAAKEIVRGLKFGGKKYYAKYIANYLLERYQRDFDGAQIDTVVCVPLTKKRKAARGYNQSLEIAKRFCEMAELPCCGDALVKVRDTQEQAKLSGEERENNLDGAFEVKSKDIVNNKSVLLVDDVMTTGSTASEIAKVLKNAGAKAVYLLTFASTKFKVDKNRGGDKENGGDYEDKMV